MLTYSYLSKRDDAASAAFAEFSKANGVTGITLFATPEVVAPDQEAIDRIQADTVNWRGELEIAIKKEAFGQAGEIKDRIQENDNLLAHVRDSGMTWLKEAMGDAWSFTKVFVVGAPDFPDAKNYPPTVGEFMQHVPALSARLLSVGLSGAVQKTPLQARVFVPIGSVQASGLMNARDWMKKMAEEVVDAYGSPPIDMAIAGGGVGYAPDAPPPTEPYPELHTPGFAPGDSLIPDKVKDLNSDEKRVAEKLLSGLAVKRAADACGMSWQSISKTLKPSIAAKFSEAGLDFDALYEKAKTERSEKSEE